MEDVEIKENYMGDDSGNKSPVPLKEIGDEGSRRDSKRESRRESRSESTEPKKPGLKEILADPFGHLTIVGFAICGCAGLIFACVAFAEMSVGPYVSFCLFAVGLYAAYEIRMLATLKKELNELEDVQKDLEEQVDRLKGQVDVYDEQNDKFRAETDELKAANDKFEGEVEELKQVNQQLTGTKDQFEHQNKELDEQLEKLNTANESLKGSLSSLKEQTDNLEGQLKQFEELQDAIGKYAEKNNTDMSEALAKQTEMFDTLKTLMSDNAQTLLNQVATDLEYADNEEGMTEEEYNKWVERIPARFRKIMDQRGITFEQFAGEDRNMDYKEMADLIEELMKEGSAEN